MLIVPTEFYQILRRIASRPGLTLRRTSMPPRAVERNGAIPDFFTILQRHGGLGGCVCCRET